MDQYEGIMNNMTPQQHRQESLKVFENIRIICSRNKVSSPVMEEIMDTVVKALDHQTDAHYKDELKWLKISLGVTEKV